MRHLHAGAQWWKPILWSSCRTSFVLALMPADIQTLQLWNQQSIGDFYIRCALGIIDLALWFYIVFCFDPELLLLLNTLLSNNTTYCWPVNIQSGWNFHQSSYCKDGILSQCHSWSYWVFPEHPIFCCVLSMVHFPFQMFANGDWMARCLIVYRQRPVCGNRSYSKTWIQ